MTPLPLSKPLPYVRQIDKLYLELLFRCNFRCAHCYHGGDLDRPETLSLSQAIGVLEYFADRFSCHHVCFLGGEPLLYPHLPALLAAAKDLGFTTQICTNAYKRRQVLIESRPHLDLLRVSLDGGTAKAHDLIRRPGSFAAAFDTIKWANSERLPFGATCTLTARNIGTVPQLARDLRDMGAHELILHRVRAVGNARDSGLEPVTWGQARRLHDALAAIDLTGMDINRHILLPDRRPASDDVVEKLEIAPDGRVYLSCAEVAGDGRDVRFDFDQRRLVHASSARTTV